MKIDMVSEHARPLAAPGGPDTGGQNVHVGAPAAALDRRGHDVTVPARRDDAGPPDTVPFATGVTVEHVTAGPIRQVARDELLPYMDEFAVARSRRRHIRPPEIPHAHFWMTELAALKGAREHTFPVVRTFHAPGSVERGHQKGADTSPPDRVHAVPREGIDTIDAALPGAPGAESA